MNEIADMLKSPTFWFGSVIVGLFINIISAYCKEPLDTFFAKYSMTRKRMAAARAALFRMDIERMALEADYMQMMAQTEMRLRFSAVTQLLGLVLLSVVITSILPFPMLDTALARLGAYGGMGIMALGLGTNVIFAVSEARKLSYKLRAAMGLKWRIAKHPFAKDFDLLARDDSKAES